MFPSAEELIDPDQKLVRAERFGEEIRGPQGQSPLAIRVLTLSRQNDHWRIHAMWKPANLTENLESREVGHHDVEQYEVDGFVTLDPVHRRSPIPHQGNVKWRSLEFELNDAADVRLIVGDENPASLVANRAFLIDLMHRGQSSSIRVSRLFRN